MSSRCGGIIAVANLRGGSEYGEKWHEGGMLDRKQNVFDDFLACRALAHRAPLHDFREAGGDRWEQRGLLVGAAITQQPKLFGAAIVQVGVLDMLRYQRWTIASAWIPEYGSSADAAQFKTLYAYSPLHRFTQRNGVSGDADHDRRPRRPGFPGPLL